MILVRLVQHRKGETRVAEVWLSCVPRIGELVSTYGLQLFTQYARVKDVEYLCPSHLSQEHITVTLR